MAFMDLKEAYDRAVRDTMWKVLRIYDVGVKLLKAVRSFHQGSMACVREGREASERFQGRLVYDRGV